MFCFFCYNSLTASETVYQSISSLRTKTVGCLGITTFETVFQSISGRLPRRKKREKIGERGRSVRKQNSGTLGN